MASSNNGKCYRCCLITVGMIIGLLILTHLWSYSSFSSGGRKKLKTRNFRPNLGRNLNLTLAQTTALDEFKIQMKPMIDQHKFLHYLNHDVFLLNWLRLAKFDVEEANKLLNENIEWQKGEKIPKIHKEDWSDFKTENEYNSVGVDLHGMPIIFINIGDWEISDMISDGKKDRLFRYIVKILDEGATLVHKKFEEEQKVTQFWLLLELENFGFFKSACASCLGIYLELAKTMEQKYPGMVEQMVTTNTPTFFSIVFNVIKPVLSEHTRENTFLLGEKKEWESFLLRQVDPTQLPKRYNVKGGSSGGADPD